MNLILEKGGQANAVKLPYDATPADLADALNILIQAAGITPLTLKPVAKAISGVAAEAQGV